VVQPAGEIGAGELVPGSTLGSYELLRRLASGGMAELYLARSRGIEGFEKVVVLKRILPQYAQNRDFVSMFLDEARLSATLQHPNIAQVHDIGQWHGSYFFTMEYIHGQDIRGVLQAAARRHQRIPLAQALTMIAGASAGLHAAHEKRSLDGRPLKIVHRDVSPSNVLVSYDGAVKVVDFGVAKAAQRQTETRTGTLKGKIAYMSPEQCLGKPLDRRSDIFSIGILLYELTTGRRLFKGEAEFGVMQRIVSEDVTPPSHLVASYPPDLEKIVIKALRRDRDERYATAQDLQLDIEHFAGSHRLTLSQVMLARFMQTLFADVLREEVGQRDGLARASTDLYDLPLKPPRPSIFDGSPVPSGPPGTPPVGVAAGSTRLDTVDVDQVDGGGDDDGGPGAAARMARLGSVPIGFLDPEDGPPDDAEAIGHGETGSIVITGGLPVPGETTRVGSMARQYSRIDTGPPTGSVQVHTHRRAVAMAAVIGAGVAALVVAVGAMVWSRGDASPSAPAQAAPLSAPPGVESAPRAAGAETPPPVPAAEAAAAPATPDAAGSAASIDMPPEPVLAPAADPQQPERKKRKRTPKPDPAEAQRRPAPDWDADSPLPPP
jgi:serine/threonine protein kinase